MAMKTVQVRLTDEQLRMIDEKVAQGIYPSRSEAIRDYVRKIEFLEQFNQFFAVTRQQPFSEEELDEIRQKVWQEKYAPRLKQK